MKTMNLGEWLQARTVFHVTIVLVVLLPVFSQTAFAQIPLDLDFGIRGGVFNSGGIPLEVPNNHHFPDIYTTDKPQFPVTVGPTIGILLNGRWYVRFEAARSRFSFHFAQGLNSPGSTVTSVTEGHSWQYPLLLTYMAGHGPVHPFGGGGISFGSSIRGTTATTTTPAPSTVPLGPFTTTTSSAPFDTRSVLTPYAFYITGGVDARISLLSIRPELRYAHWGGFNTNDINFQDDTILFPQNQFEFLLSVTVHPIVHRR
jgi:hypothetical protein